MRTLLSYRLALAVLLLGVGAALALGISQETPVGGLKGRIVAQETGNPIQTTANLYLQPKGYPNHYVESDKDGRFVFENIPVGVYSLEIRGEAHSMKPLRVVISEGKSQEIEAELKPGEPNLEMYVHQHIFTPDEKSQVTCRGFVPESDYLDIRLYKVNIDEFLSKWHGDLPRLLGQQSYWGDSGYSVKTNLDANPALRLVTSFEKRISARDSEGIFTQRINLPQLPPGLYVCSAKTGGMQAIGWTMVTSLGMVSKNSGQQTLAYVVDLKTGTPIPGAAVSVYSGSGLAASAKTDQQGLATLEAKRAPGDDSRITAVARSGESVAFVSTWYYSEGPGSTQIYSYTDRPVYRPGQKVFFKGIVRQYKQDRYVVPAGTAVTVEVHDPNDTLIYRTVLQTDKFGSYYGSLNLNSETASGYYSVIARTPGQEQGEQTSFRVASYRKPEFSVKVTFDKDRVTRGDLVQAKIKASYYFGAPVSNANITYSIQRTAYWFSMDEDEYADYYDDRYGDYEGYDDYGGYGEQVKEGDARTDENGEAVIEFPADWPQPKKDEGYDTDQQFMVYAYISDKSGQEADGNGTVTATRGDFAMTITPDSYVASPGSKVGVSIVAMDYKRRPVRNKQITVSIGHERWTGDESEFQLIQDRTVTTDKSGKAHLTYTGRSQGDLRFTAQVRDTHGNLIIESTYVWFYSGYGEIEGAHYPDLQIITDRKSYNPGDTAKVLINTSKPGATALVTVEGERVYDSRTVVLRGKSTTVELPIKDAYKPNFYIGVCFVKNKQFTQQDARARVSLRNQALKVKVTPDKKRYRPGDTATYTLSTTDTSGNPVSAQVSVGVVDEAIYAIEPDTTPAILGFFYSRKPNQVNTQFSFPQIYLSDPDKAGAPTLKEEAKNIRIRKRFLDTAFWAPAVVTDSSGQATVRFDMPDNLTTWRATARAITADTRCGDVTSKVICRQDMLVRLETPRFLVQKDQTTITAMVHNYTGRSQGVDVYLAAPGLKVDGDRHSHVTVGNDGSQRIDWQVTALRPGSFDITVKAMAGRYGDAMQLSVPVYPHGEERRDARTGSLTSGPAASMNVEVRQDAIPEATKLTVRVAPSLASTMLGSLEWLAQYPYGCTEQTTSSFLPDVIIWKALKDLGVSNPSLQAQLPDMVSKGLSRLYRFQLENGSWGWCEYGEGDPWMTAYVCYALIQAREAGFSVNGSALERGTEQLAKMLKRKRLDASKRAYGYYVLALAGQDTAPSLRAMQEAGGLSSRTLALLALSYSKLGLKDDAQAILEQLYRRAIVEPGMIHWPGEGYETGAVETTALGLEAALGINRSDPRVTDIVRWLMTQRLDNCWYSTRETAMTLYAMSEYLKGTKELHPNYDAAIKINGKVVSRLHLGPESVFQPDQVVEIRDMNKGRNRLEITKSGPGNLYYSTSLVQFVARKSIPPMPSGEGVSITRSYYKPPSRFFERRSGRDIGPAVTSCDAGDVVFVRIIVNATKPLEHMLVEDFVPAGCEIIDKGHIDYYDWTYWYVGRDVRDERISFYIDELSPGRHILDYQMRAGFAGTYTAMPAQVFAMYQLQIRATTGGTEFEIR